MNPERCCSDEAMNVTKVPTYSGRMIAAYFPPSMPSSPRPLSLSFDPSTPQDDPKEQEQREIDFAVSNQNSQPDMYSKTCESFFLRLRLPSALVCSRHATWHLPSRSSQWSMTEWRTFDPTSPLKAFPAGDGTTSRDPSALELLIILLKRSSSSDVHYACCCSIAYREPPPSRKPQHHSTLATSIYCPAHLVHACIECADACTKPAGR